MLNDAMLYMLHIGFIIVAATFKAAVDMSQAEALGVFLIGMILVIVPFEVSVAMSCLFQLK